MAQTKRIKLALLATFSLVFAAWAFSGSFSTVRGDAVVDEFVVPETAATMSDDYVGTETCAACHDDQFKNFSPTKHAKLKEIPSWKDKVVGCEACHGPGKAHSEDPKPTNIVSFKQMSSKQASESCLACHAGKESHNSFRQGEHFRNNVGCNDCHAVHGPGHKNIKADSASLIARASKQRPSDADTAMLRESEPMLCMSCHNEVKSHFSKPFRHKVLEGTMKCSDCHNAHGGFESKQTKLAVGADQSCVRCHSDKQGPFVFEHGPIKLEGCATCHTPHGSSNPKMLKRAQIRQVCMECHTGITDELSPGLPSRHNQAQMRERNCTVCHSAVHGSNSSRLFFR